MSIIEARRQVEVCNACRYCEGYCSVFPAINRQRSFADGDITQLANLCHNCRGCYYACQYTAPHEFNINIPAVLADVRVESWERYIRPTGFAQQFQRRGVAIGLMLIAGFALIMALMQGLRPAKGDGFYAFLSHTVMVLIFAPAFILPIVIIWTGLSRYWKDIGAAPIQLDHFKQAIADAANLKNLSGGQGQGCNFEQGDRFSNTRRWLHAATMWGFLLCFASTSSATVMHYALNLQAPYPLFSVPKLLGIIGGLSLTIGCLGLAWLKTRADSNLGATGVWGGEMAFVLLLGATGATGLALYTASSTAAVPALLAIHLGTVLTFFFLMPYSKMVHSFFRLAALLRDAQLSNR